jgi:hypothetical protein
MLVHSAPHSFMVISDLRTTAILSSVYEGWGSASNDHNDCNDPLRQFMKLGHFWKIKCIHGTYHQYPTYAILNLCDYAIAKQTAQAGCCS